MIATMENCYEQDFMWKTRRNPDTTSSTGISRMIVVQHDVARRHVKMEACIEY